MFVLLITGISPSPQPSPLFQGEGGSKSFLTFSETGMGVRVMRASMSPFPLSIRCFRSPSDPALYFFHVQDTESQMAVDACPACSGSHFACRLWLVLFPDLAGGWSPESGSSLFGHPSGDLSLFLSRDPLSGSRGVHRSALTGPSGTLSVIVPAPTLALPPGREQNGDRRLGPPVPVSFLRRADLPASW
jgi:hypothetical protein